MAKEFQDRFQAIIECRNRATTLTLQAQQAYEQAIGPVDSWSSETNFSIQASKMFAGRRRMEGSYHSPAAQTIVDRFPRSDKLGEIVSRIWWETRFKRVFGANGMPYMSADDLFTTNPYELKSVLVEGKKDLEKFLVKKNWIVMACSGQVYGLNGTARLVTDYHRSFFLSHDVIRIAPNSTKARPGYLLTALTHPKLGRPVVIRVAYGMSIPHLDPDDVADVPIPRLEPRQENHIADLAEEAAIRQAEAESLEREAVEAATAEISMYLAQ